MKGGDPMAERLSGKNYVLVIQNNKPADLYRLFRDGSLFEVPYTKKRARRSIKTRLN